MADESVKTAVSAEGAEPKKQNSETVTNASEVGSTNGKDGANKAEALVDWIVNALAVAISNLVYKASDRNEAIRYAKLVVGTVLHLNSTEEFATGVRVGSDLYRYDEYKCPPRLAKLLLGAKVVVYDVPSAKDFLDRKAYAYSGTIGTPAEIATACKRLSTMLRANPEMQALSRPSLTLLSDAAPNAVTKKFVHNRDQEYLAFLTLAVDGEANVAIQEWISYTALNLFS